MNDDSRSACWPWGGQVNYGTRFIDGRPGGRGGGGSATPEETASRLMPLFGFTVCFILRYIFMAIFPHRWDVVRIRFHLRKKRKGGWSGNSHGRSRPLHAPAGPTIIPSLRVHLFRNFSPHSLQRAKTDGVNLLFEGMTRGANCG